MPINPKGQQVCIFGDRTIDWALTPLDQDKLQYSHERLHLKVGLRWQKGGVFLLHSLINAVSKELETLNHYNDPMQSSLSQYETAYNHSYAVWGSYQVSEDGQPDRAYSLKKITRVERYVGFREGGHPEITRTEDDEAFVKHKNHTPRVIVIDDASLGFRDRFSDPRELSRIIPKIAPRPEPWIILKMSDKVADGNLWKQIHSRLQDSGDWIRERLIVQTSAARMRAAHGEISRDLSWERSANDVLTEIQNCSSLKGLALCRYLIVHFGPTGALLLERNRRDALLTLVYDASSMEGDWADRHRQQGMMFGYGSSLCANLVAKLVGSDSQDPNLLEGIKSGLTSIQLLHQEGFQARHENEFGIPASIFDAEDDLETNSGKPKLNEEERTELHRRYRHIHESLKVSKVPVSQAADRQSYLPIMPEPAKDLNSPQSKLLEVAKKGVQVIEHGVPVGKFGDLVTVDRGEIESLRAIRNLVSNYCDNAGLDSKPVAVAVFGGPGSGKGYAIKQLVKPWRNSGRIEPLEPFNLSQFSSPSDLVGALHQIRDVGLQGPIPLAFWDEFDTPLDGTELGWLRYFLAPIQDGKFQQGEQVHLIGPAVFVFAGGTFQSFDNFDRKALTLPAETKAADFVSRLQGYIDIADVNSRGRKSPGGYLMLRRALILHSLLESNKVARREDGAFRVDDGIVHAFLGVRRYEHGVRSIEAIIKMSRRGNSESLNRSCLPSQEQLNMHVSGEEFLDLMRQHQSHNGDIEP
ncbi:hypothetical protein ABZ502_15335 [Streptomyces abikoensis]|uniref:hypothetical protein n=1 Tax=Streptomyces abikoensis TaxID=97398 RepID=UPI0033CF5526